MPKFDWTHNIQNFTGGIADNPYFVGEWQFVDWVDVNIRDYAPLIALKSWVTQAFTTTKEMYCWVDEFLFWEDWYWYTVTGTNFLQTSLWTDILWCAKFNDSYIFRQDNSSNPYMGIIDVDEATWSSDWTLEASYNGTYIPTGWTGYRIAISNHWVSSVVFWWLLYFSVWNKVLTLSANEVVEEWITNLAYDIVALTVYWSRIRIYLENGDILYWDWASANYDESVPLWEDIYLVNGKIGIDNIITGASWVRSTYWRGSWYELNKIKDNISWFRVDRAWKVAQFGIAQLEDIVYIPWWYGSKWIYTYWRSIPWFRESLNFEYSTASTGYAIETITMIYQYAHKIYIAYEDSNWGKWVDKLTWSYDTGYIVTYVFDARTRLKKKVLRELEIHWNTPWVSDNVQIYYRKDVLQSIWVTGWHYSREYNLQTWTWTLLFDSASKETKVNRVYGKDYDVEFYDIQFKIVLNWDATLSDLVLYGDFIKL